jgi:hypothetical protein
VKKKGKGFVPCGYVTLPTGDPAEKCHLIWCFNEVGKEAIGVVFAPARTPKDELREGLANAVRRAPNMLFQCEGVLNKDPLQCCGPFRVPIGTDMHIFHTVHWSLDPGKSGNMRAFLLLGARDCEHALRMLWGLHKVPKKGGKGMLASDTIKMVLEFEDLLGENILMPRRDFIFTYAKMG